MWFLPILLVGAIAMAVARRSSRKALPPARQISAGPPRTALPAGPPGAPGPISVLGEILRVGQTPPPTVILCAIAEAQAIGRNDLASDIVKVFIAPVVYHHQRARARGGRPSAANYERGGSCEVPRAPRRAAESTYSPPPPPPPPFDDVSRPTWSTPPPVVPRAEASATSATIDPSTVTPSLEQPSMDDEINALLHADPERFMEMVSRGGQFQPAVRAPQASSVVPAPEVPPPTLPSIDPFAQPMGLPPRIQEAAGIPEAADSTRTVPPGSPIPGVNDSAWREFVARLKRESPQFSSARHVGQYRQRRERLAELGIEPAGIEGSAQAQRAALDADLADAHRHGVAGELFSQHLGRPIVLPGRDRSETITLSGVLGVIQYAGLEGAVGWLERASDRKRYPHTTQAFLTTNGAF